MKTIDIAGITVNLERKKIKNLYIHVKPPHGHVFISAPMKMESRIIHDFVLHKSQWIKTQQLKCQHMKPDEKHSYLDGDTVTLWGKKYPLKLIEAAKPDGAFYDGTVFLTVPPDSTPEQREKSFDLLLKSQLESALPPLIAKYEALIGVHSEEWRIRKMRTRWGTCNTKVHRIWLNSLLAAMDSECLEYIIVHELCHLLVRSHSGEFKALLDKYYPDWRDIKKQMRNINAA